MARVIGYVKLLQNGTFFAKDAQGVIRELKAGDQIFQNELVYGDPKNSQNAQVIIDITLTDAKDITLLGSAELYTDLTIIGGSFDKEEAIASEDTLQDAWKLSTLTPNIEGQVDTPAAGLEETAAGEQGPTDNARFDTSFNTRTGDIGNVATSLRSASILETDNQVPLAIQLDSQNDVPVAVTDSFILNEDASITSTLAGNDTPSADGGNVWS
ncbi:MAG: hypothetical protein KA253_01435, partial [Campylobacteraceae bacterium]|nr:hypothetical protein [Campylobacteraceae bacterium]